mgnify:CR=1 FL=1
MVLPQICTAADESGWLVLVLLDVKVGLLLPLENMKLLFATSADAAVPGLDYTNLRSLWSSLRQTYS